MNCPNCGSSLSAKGKYCPFCGTKIPEDVLVRFESKQETFSETIDHGEIAKAQRDIRRTEERTHRKKHGVIILAILVFGFVALIAMGLEYASPGFWSQAMNGSQDYREHVRLQKIEQKVIQYISEEKYEQAYAMTGTLHFKAENSITSSTYIKQWDKTRQELEERLENLLGIGEGSVDPEAGGP